MCAEAVMAQAREALQDDMLKLARLILAEGDGAAEALGADLARTVLTYCGVPAEEDTLEAPLPAGFGGMKPWYSLDWTRWLQGESIATSTWTATGGIVTLAEAAIRGNETVVWAGGTLASQSIALTNHIATIEGREGEVTLPLTVRK